MHILDSYADILEDLSLKLQRSASTPKTGTMKIFFFVVGCAYNTTTPRRAWESLGGDNNDEGSTLNGYTNEEAEASSSLESISDLIQYPIFPRFLLKSSHRSATHPVQCASRWWCSFVFLTLKTTEIRFIRVSENPSFKTVSAWRRSRTRLRRGQNRSADVRLAAKSTPPIWIGSNSTSPSL